MLREGVWSALTAASFQVGTTPTLRISEVHFHPAEPTPLEIAAGHNSDNAFEFLELINIGGAPVDLVGVALVDDVAPPPATSRPWVDPSTRSAIHRGVGGA